VLPFLHGGECRCNSGHPSGTSSLCNLSTRRFRSMAALWACRTSSPRVNSSVILATNTTVFGGRCPGVRVTKASSKVGEYPLMPSTGRTS
jgi:hypothetical protein